MKKNLTELVFILDRSGSMGGLEQDTIGGFNAMLTRQKEQVGEANVTTILFDHEVQLLHDRFPLKAVAPLTEKDYYVRGCTALLDAIGYGVEKMANIQRHLPEDERAEKVIFVIFEDALRNAVSLGGDSDTLACITGGIAEAFYGMPQELRDETLKHPRKVRGWCPAHRAACSSADEGFA